MAGIKLQRPNFGHGGKVDATKIISFLYQLTDELNYALNHLDAENFSESGQKALKQYGDDTAKKVVELSSTQTASFQKLRDDIVKTANKIQNEYKSEISKTESELRTAVSEMYVAKSEGDEDGTVAQLKAYTESAIAQSAKNITLSFSETASIASATQKGLEEYQLTIDTYIRFDPNGIEIGKKSDDQSLPYSVKITNEKMSFYQSGVEVAYIQYNKLYITSVEVLDRFSIGSKAMGGFFDLDTSELGAGWLWRDV